MNSDQIALVAVPPSYFSARMYNFSAHQMTHPLCYYPTLTQPPHYAGV